MIYITGLILLLVDY